MIDSPEVLDMMWEARAIKPGDEVQIGDDEEAFARAALVSAAPKIRGRWYTVVQGVHCEPDAADVPIIRVACPPVAAQSPEEDYKVWLLRENIKAWRPKPT